MAGCNFPGAINLHPTPLDFQAAKVLSTMDIHAQQVLPLTGKGAELPPETPAANGVREKLFRFNRVKAMVFE
jgi:hypothetical protein